MDMVELLDQRVAHTGKIVAGVQPEQMNAPTPCVKFDVRALLNHIVGGQLLMARAASGEPAPRGSEMPDVVGDDSAGAYERSSKQLMEAFRQPGVFERTFPLAVEVTGEQALGIALMESVVHGWDLATATGQDATIAPELANGMLETLREQGLIETFRTEHGDPFAYEVDVSPDASPGDRLVAYLGRKP